MLRARLLLEVVVCKYNSNEHDNGERMDGPLRILDYMRLVHGLGGFVRGWQYVRLDCLLDGGNIYCSIYN